MTSTASAGRPPQGATTASLRPDVLDADAPAFSSVVRDATADVHREAERSGFIADLIRNKATRAGYALYLRNLLPVYEAMEAELLRHHRTSGAAAAFAEPALARRGALQSDLERIAGPAWRARLRLLPETAAYARAIEDAAVDVTGVALAAHAYARYLGDLSGGQILKALLAKTLRLEPSELAFYEFPELADQGSAKSAMRQAIDGIADEPGREAFLAQATLAFRHTIAMSLAIQSEAAPS